MVPSTKFVVARPGDQERARGESACVLPRLIVLLISPSLVSQTTRSNTYGQLYYEYPTVDKPVKFCEQSLKINNDSRMISRVTTTPRQVTPVLNNR